MTAKLSLFCQALAVSLAIAIVYHPAPTMAVDLTLFVEKKEAVFHIRAVGTYETVDFSIGPRAGFTQKLVQIYERIEPDPDKDGTLDKVGGFMDQQYRTVRDFFPFWKKEKQADKGGESQSDTLEQLLTEAGALFYGPMESLLTAARHVEFVIAEDHLFYPLDVLHAGDGPLFLEKKVSYRISKKKTTIPKADASWRGLIVADEGSDPERGAQKVMHQFPGAFGFETEHVKREDIAGISSVDFILISAEGVVDGLQMKHLILRPQTISGLHPELVYFDCDLYGLNLNFITHFNQTGVAAFVAPIFSRQAGEATAQTMIRFFRTLLNGGSPSQALYMARKTIYDATVLDGEDKLTALRRAFPFRLYRLN